MTKQTTTTLAAIAGALVLLPALLTGCSGAPSVDTTPSAAGDRKARAAAVASCMREKGFDVPDPSGDGTTTTLPDGVDPDQFSEAVAACAKDAGIEEGGTAQEAPGAAEAAKKAAECIRENGFSDYPDDAEAQYEPADQDAFDAVAKKCDDEAFGSLGSTVAG